MMTNRQRNGGKDQAAATQGPRNGASGRENLGLHFDKFYTGWNDDWSTGGEEKARWLKGIVQSSAAGAQQVKDLLAERRSRTEALVDARSGRMGLFRSIDRLVVGTGRSHPVENGFSFHHTLGVPYLPGSSLKGVLREWAQRARSDTSLLGTTQSVGMVDVLDALPIEPVSLVVEVLTPHYGGWTPEDPPGDWRNPLPIPYLALEEGATFLVALMPSSSERLAIDQCWELLVPALGCVGVGARTSLGFGRLELVEELRHVEATGTAAVRAQAVATSPEDRWRSELGRCNDQEVYERTRAAVQGDGVAAEELLALVVVLEEAGYLPAWRVGRKKGSETTGPKKLRELAQRLDALALREGGGHGDRE